MGWYRILLGLVGLIVAPYGYVRAAFGSVIWTDRLAINKNIKQAKIWIHASSVGEVRVAETLIRRLLQHNGHLALHLTVMTRAGYEIASAIVQKLPEPVAVSYAPLDTRRWVSRFINQLRPETIIITETEIWPNLISTAYSSNIKILLVNGRMTPRSYERYQKVRGLLSSVLSKYDRCFFKTAEDMERFVSLGLASASAEVAGDMKFDGCLGPVSEDTIAQERKRLGIRPEQFLIVAGSTRSGKEGEEDEEGQLLHLYAKLKSSFPQVRLLLAPRHLERVEAVSRKVQAAAYPVGLVDSETTTIDGSNEPVLVVGYIGGLIQLYRAADLAFVGGTLVSKGGHNLLEPVWTGTPVIFGPSLDNVGEASDYVITNRYGSRVNNIDDMTEMAGRLISGETKFERRRSDDSSHSATNRVISYLKQSGMI